MVVREVEDGEVSQLCDVPGDLGELVAGEVQSLQRVHPDVGTADGEVSQLVAVGVQVNL